MKLTSKQQDVKKTIEQFAEIFEVDPVWASAVAMTESSLGIHQLSPTGCKGVFQMSMVAMKDLWILMQESDDELVDCSCGTGFLRLLLRRHKFIEAATKRYCAPKDRGFYWDRVRHYMKELG